MIINIYENSSQYNSEKPALELDIENINFYKNRVEVEDVEGYTHILKNFFAITFKNEYSFDFGNKEVYFYLSTESYNNSKPEITVSVREIDTDKSFLILKNEYVHIINTNKLFAFVYKK